MECSRYITIDNEIRKFAQHARPATQNPVNLKIHIDINKHVDVISVVQRTVSRDRQDIAADIQVYAQKVRPAI